MAEKNEPQSYSIHIINSLAIILRTVELHDSSNDAVKGQMEKMASFVNESIFEAADSFRIDLIGNYFYENNKRIKYPLKYHFHFDSLAQKFKQRNLGAVVFRENITLEEIKAFIDAFIGAGNSETPFEVIHDAVANLAGLDVELLKPGNEETVSTESIRRLIKNTYFIAVSLSKGVMDRLRAKESVNIKKTKRIVQSFVDFISKEEQFLLGMTAIKNYDDYTYHHSVNVSILALALGQRLGLSKRELTELGIVAFFHDIGKLDLPPEMLNKSASFSDEEFAVIMGHPISGVKTLLSLKALDPLVIRSAITAFEHHLNSDCSGYPKAQMAFIPDVYSKIVNIADRYDATTSARVYREAALPPDVALGMLMDDGGSKIDPVLLNIFIMMVGVFPIGTLVLLDTKELGVVCEGNPSFIDKPKVRVIADSSGLKKNYVVDLSETTAEGRYAKRIIKRLDSNQYDINLAEYLL